MQSYYLVQHPIIDTFSLFHLYQNLALLFQIIITKSHRFIKYPDCAVKNPRPPYPSISSRRGYSSHYIPADYSLTLLPSVSCFVISSYPATVMVITLTSTWSPLA